MTTLQKLQEKGKTQTTQTMKYDGSDTPRILIISQTPHVPTKWVTHLRIPTNKLGILTIKTNNNKLTNKTQEILIQYLTHLNPEMIITIGSIIGKYFMPELKIKKDKGNLYSEDETFHKYKMCTLMGQGWYRMQKWASEWKQLEKLKNYLMNVMEYGT